MTVGFNPTTVERVREGFVPLLRELAPGYDLLEGGSGVLIALSIFESAAEALKSSEMAADSVTE
jgi:hypothetical protein